MTTLESARVPIEHLVRRYGMGARVRVRAADVPVLALEQPQSGALDKLRRQIEHALEDDHAEAIVLGCAGMADLATELARDYRVPVIDGVSAAVKQVEAVVALGLATSKRGTYARPLAKAYTGMMEFFAP